MHRVSFFLSSYICIVAFHLDTIDEPREGCDVGAEPEDGEWWTRLEDGWMDGSRCARPKEDARRATIL